LTRDQQQPEGSGSPPDPPIRLGCLLLLAIGSPLIGLAVAGATQNGAIGGGAMIVAIMLGLNLAPRKRH